jgi:hypothetical protein
MKMVERLMRWIHWLARIAGWLYKARRVWEAVLAVPVAFLISWIFLPTWEPRLRIAGLLLQLLGIGAVAYGLREIRLLFRLPSQRQIAVGWFKRFPRLKEDAVVVVGSAATMAGAGAVTAYGTVSLPPTASLEERIAALEQDRQRTWALMGEIQGRMEQEARVRKSELESERGERTVQDEKTRKLLEEAAVGGLYLEITGIAWLLIGVICATASSEIANLIAKFVYAK